MAAMPWAGSNDRNIRPIMDAAVLEMLPIVWVSSELYATGKVDRGAQVLRWENVTSNTMDSSQYGYEREFDMV